MAFDPFGYILVLKSIFDEKNYLSMGTPYTFDGGMLCHSTKIEVFYFDDNFRRIAQWVRPLTQFNFGRMASHAFIESIWCSH